MTVQELSNEKNKVNSDLIASRLKEQNIFAGIIYGMMKVNTEDDIHSVVNAIINNTVNTSLKPELLYTILPLSNNNYLIRI